MIAETATAATAATLTDVGSAAPAEPHWRKKLTPDRIGRWRVLDRLGEGGMGEVFRVVDDDGGVAALKRARTTRGSYVRALRREATALEALWQPGIARLVERGEADGKPWYAMAYVDGPTLGRFVADRPMAERLPQLVGLCLILDRLHRAGGVHRDVKPANVLIEDGAPVLVDFGLLVRIGGGRGQPGWARDAVHGAPDASGTAGYRAPELRRGEWCDGRTDLFAVGRILGDWLEETGDRSPKLAALAAELQADDPADRPRDGATAARRLALVAGLDPPVVDADGTPLHRAPSVGRNAELLRLDDALERARRGRGGLVVLDGPSGIGKTRLALEAVRRADGFRAIVGECRAVGGGLLQGVVDVIRFAVDHCRADAGRTLAVFGSHGPALSPYVPAVAELPGQTGGMPPPGAARVAAAMVHVVEALAVEIPLLVVVDDVQWADQVTALTLARLADVSGRALIVLTARCDSPSEVVERLRAGRHLAWLTLAPLRPPEAGALVGRLLGDREPDPVLVAEIVRRSTGNPFFVAECLRAMIAEGRLRAVGDGWRFSGPRATVSMPAPVEAIIRARLDRLSPPGRAIIDALAVLGRRTGLDRIGALLDTPLGPAVFDEVVRRAVCARSDDMLRFTHNRLRQVALARIDNDRRRMLHARAADDLHARPPSDAYAGARARAFHLDGAGRRAAAGDTLAEAGRLAEARGAVEDAAICHGEAAARTDGLTAARARLDQGRCLAAGGRYREATVAQREAFESARSAGVRDLEATAGSALGLSLVLIDQLGEAEDVLRRAIELFTALDDATERATACTRLATVCVHRGALDEAEALQRQALAVHLSGADTLGMARTLNNLAIIAGTRQRYDDAVALVSRALEAARAANRPSMTLGIRMHRAQLLHRAGELDEARAELDGSIDGLRDARMLTQLGWAQVGRATLRRHMGDALAPGWADLAAAEAIFAEFDYATCHAVLAIERGHHLLAEGRDATTAVQRARTQATRAGVEPETPSVIGRALAGLIESQACFAAGQPLHRGQRWSRIFLGVRRWLVDRDLAPGR